MSKMRKYPWQIKDPWNKGHEFERALAESVRRSRLTPTQSKWIVSEGQRHTPIHAPRLSARRAPSALRPAATMNSIREDLRTDDLLSDPLSCTLHLRWCSYCGRPMSRKKRHITWDTEDHVTPRSEIRRRRANVARLLSVISRSNVVRCCYECNQDKGSKSLLSFLLRQPLMYRTDRYCRKIRRRSLPPASAASLSSITVSITP